MNVNYLDFELKIAGQSGRYLVQVLGSPAGEASCEFQRSLTDAELENLLLKLARVRSATRQVDPPELAAARKLGAELFRAAFRDTVRDCLRSSMAAAQRDGHGLRMKLRLQDAPELAVLPWEFLYDPDAGRFLARSAYTPIVRYVELPESISAFHAVRPLRLLGIVASPLDYDGVDVQRERILLGEALAPVIQSGQLEISWLVSFCMQ
ncbi:MAG: hypothetical protein U0X20_29580 [Caldilineaceae bacterium]